jgi:hypothetical protein
VPFDSSTGNQFGTILDYDVYEDIVEKMVQHYTPSMIEVGNEPDGSWFQYMNPTDYATYYYHVAHAIRSVNLTVPIGGPATSIPGHTDYIAAMQVNANILPSYVNFISQHSYGNSYTANFDTSMLRAARTKWRNAAGYVSEWNADGNCANGSSLDNNDPSTVGWIGANLIAAIAAGQNAIYFGGFSGPSGYGCAWFNDARTTLLPKVYAWKVLQQIGLATGAGSVMSTSFNGLSEAVGIVNSAGLPAVALANWFSPLNVTVTLNNLNLSGTVGVTVYMADFAANDGTVPFSTFDTDVTSGSTTFTVPMTADSTVGVILGSPVPSPSPTPTPQPTPTPSTSSNWIGYAVTLRR